MAMERHKETSSKTAPVRSAEPESRPLAEFATQADAIEFIRKLRNKIVHVTVSEPGDPGAKYAEFEIPVSDFVMVALDSFLKIQAKASPPEPSERLAAALEESKRIEPRFSSAQELFDALEKEGQD